jgi:TRAP-type C4-dicarboxylate transport system substrate-binding protein
MKRARFLLVMTVVFLLASEQAGNADVIFAKLGTTLSSTHPTSQALINLQQEIEQSLAGQLYVQLFPEAQLRNAVEILEGLQFGDIEIGVVPSELLVPSAPEFLAVSLPYIFRDNEHRFRVLDGPVGMQILNSLKQHNLIGLGFLDTGIRNILTRQEAVETPEVLQGQKIGILRRCPKSDCQGIIPELIKQSLIILGATPKLIEPKESFVSLQTEIISGLECHQAEILELKLYELESVYFTSGMYYSVPDVLVVSKRWFDALTPQIQHVLREASRSTVRRQRTLWSAHEKEIFSAIEAQGVVIKASNQEIFQNTIQALYTAIHEKFGVTFTDVVRSIMAIK